MDIAAVNLSAVNLSSGVTSTGHLSLDKTAKTDGAGFGVELGGAIDSLQQLQSESKTLAIKAVTGDLPDIHTAMIASSRAQVTLELVAAVRNKGVEAFNDIMRMQA